jgi:hypothetical protein
MTWDNVWVRMAAVLVGSVGAVALVTRITIWLVYCFKAAPGRSGSEEMDLADKAERERDLLEGKSTYTSYEQWRKDILSDKPLSEIVGRVPEGFFEKKPEPDMTSSGGVRIDPYGISGFSGFSGFSGYLGGASGFSGYFGREQMARQRLAEMQARLAGEEDKRVKTKLEEIRRCMLSAAPVEAKAPYSPMGNVLKPYCQNCHGSGYVTVLNTNGIPTSGVRCACYWAGK